MSTTDRQRTDSSIDDDQLARLTIEAGKYLGATSGEQIPRQEVRLQAEANGYSSEETDAVLSAEEVTITVPRQGDLFGEWPGNTPCGTPGADSPNQFQQFNTYRKNHESTFSEAAARKRFARTKSVDRYFVRTYESCTTLMVTFTIDASTAPLAQQAASLYPRALVRLRRKILKELGVYDSYAGVEVLSPKYTTPGADTPSVHAHSFLWLPGIHSAEEFTQLIEAHVKHVDGARAEDHPPGKAVTVRHWGPQHRVPLPQSPVDVQRGASTTLPYEVARNLPYLKHPNAEYVEKWAAAMWQDAETNTVPRFRPMGRPSRFKRLAEQGKTFDRIREARFCAEAVTTECGIPGAVAPSPTHDSVDVQPHSGGVRASRESCIKAVARLAQVSGPMEQ